MNTTPAIHDTAKAKGQGFLLLGVSALCLLVLVPALLLTAHFATNAGTQRIMLLIGFAPLILGLGLALLGNRLLAGKTKPF